MNAEEDLVGGEVKAKPKKKQGKKKVKNQEVVQEESKDSVLYIRT